MAIGTKKISQVSNSLSKGTTEQAGAVEELTATIGGILEQTKNNAENADKASQLIDLVKEKADKGNVEMNEMLSAIEEINVGVCEKISVSLIFYDKFLGWRMPQSFSGNHPALAAL